jgi:hypothetical protein
LGSGSKCPYLFNGQGGQTPLILGGIILVILILRLPAAYIPVFCDRIINRMTNGYLVGYALSILMVAGWYLNVRFVLKFKNNEIDRLSKERNFYQQKCIGDIESSE